MRDIVVASQNPGGPVTFISDTSYSVASTVNVGGHPQGIVYDSGTGAIFVSTEGDTNSWVSVIPDYSNAVTANVTVQNVPIGLAYDSGKEEIFAAIVSTSELVNPDLGVTIISDQTNSVVASVPMSEGTVNLAYDNKQGLIFVSYAGESNVISVISDSSNSVVANVTLADPTLRGLCYDSAKSEIFAPNFYNSTVTVISDQLATYPTTTPSSTPTVPEFSGLIIPLLLIITMTGGLLIYFKKHKLDTELVKKT
jgi:DNA-binding beta-propeller fold protein YncE